MEKLLFTSPNILQKVQSLKPIQLPARTFPLDVKLQLAALKQYYRTKVNKK